MVALALAVTMSVLGIVDLLPADLISKVIPLTLGVVAFAMLRERWRQEALNTRTQETTARTEETLSRLDERLERAKDADDHLAGIHRAVESLTTIRTGVGSEVTKALATARGSTDRWVFKGGTGAYTRSVLPKYVSRAAYRHTSVRIEILDPADEDACERYARLHRSLAEGEDDDARSWTAEGTRIESYATILAACWFKERYDTRLDLELAVTSTVSIFRWDLSSSNLIVTQRGPWFPAMIIGSDHPFYDSFDIELSTSFSQGRPVPLERAREFGLLPEPDVDTVRILFGVLGSELPRDFDDKIVRTIIEKALRDPNPAPLGAGNRARPESITG
ncbi:hypothetical protein [Nocardia sp. BMG51109]|uniref:hypothetical protein n=1 Tax=Nocardia sp. BMG51109 TaxID=1056816 RepID=UPI0012EB698D|nr:hypothetical protein [Nocardia sp. BMG51109]